MEDYKITGRTRLACLLGDPVEHSISPVMHNEAFRLLGIDCAYMAFQVGTENLEQVVDSLKKMNVLGFNLTMPDKNKIVELCDELTPAVEIGGAANTVVNRDGKLVAYTTDGIGFMEACKAVDFHIIGKKMTLLGAGGAARSILIQAALDGVKEITVFSRKGSNWEEAEQLIEKLCQKTSCKITHFDYSDKNRFKDEIHSSQILVNGTSVGMGSEDSLITDLDCFYPDLMVYDVIYHPAETKLLRQAKERGCRVSNGHLMLLYQGAAAFQIWTGQEMPTDIIREKFFCQS